jgi:hypothetical protein
LLRQLFLEPDAELYAEINTEADEKHSKGDGDEIKGAQGNEGESRCEHKSCQKRDQNRQQQPHAA